MDLVQWLVSILAVLKVWILLAEHMWRVCVPTVKHQTARHHSCAVDWSVGRRPVTTQSRNKHQAILCGIFGGRSSTATQRSPNTAVFPCQHHNKEVLHSFVYLSST